MQRITQKNLETSVAMLNRITGSPQETYTRVDGKYRANIGNYHLDGAYGGWKLVRIVSEGGGITDVLHCGFVSKRELFNLMGAYIAGLDAKV